VIDGYGISKILPVQKMSISSRNHSYPKTEERRKNKSPSQTSLRKQKRQSQIPEMPSIGLSATNARIRRTEFKGDHPARVISLEFCTNIVNLLENTRHVFYFSIGGSGWGK